MEKIPHYENGQWSEGDDRLTLALEALADDTTDLTKLRLAVVVHLGYGDDFSITLYGPGVGLGPPEADIPPYVIDITGEAGWSPGYPGFLTAGTLPDAMDLVSKWAPVVTAFLLSEDRRLRP